MSTRVFLPGLSTAIVATLTLAAADPPALEPHLEPLRPWIEKTWRGEFEASTPERPVIDIARWERALNGNAVRILHSINDGVYGGESILMWDEQQQAVTYYYFTTAGFRTNGKITFENDALITHEIIAGNAGGVTEVRAKTEMRADGTFTVKTEHLKDGQWTKGRETTYREDAAAKVVFK
jgi:hypothetical protein